MSLYEIILIEMKSRYNNCKWIIVKSIGFESSIKVYDWMIDLFAFDFSVDI